jgi:hypothetical protein
MISLNFKGRDIVNVYVEDLSDYPDFTNAYISYAEWADTKTELTEHEYLELSNDFDLVYEAAYEAAHGGQ